MKKLKIGQICCLLPIFVKDVLYRTIDVRKQKSINSGDCSIYPAMRINELVILSLVLQYTIHI